MKSAQSIIEETIRALPDTSCDEARNQLLIRMHEALARDAAERLIFAIPEILPRADAAALVSKALTEIDDLVGVAVAAYTKFGLANDALNVATAITIGHAFLERFNEIARSVGGHA